MDPFSLALGGVGLVTNLIGGFFAKKAANKAGELQYKAGMDAAQNVTDITNAENPKIGQAATRAGDRVTSAAQVGSAGVMDTAHAGAAGVSEAAERANVILQPYQQAGSVAASELEKGVTAGGQFNKTPTMADIQIDPGYAFRLQQGQDALLRSGAARGGALGGSAAKDLISFNSGSASQEYSNAFDRYERNRKNNYEEILGVSGQGMVAGGKQGDNLTASARFGADTVNHASEFGANMNSDAAKYSGTIEYDAAGRMVDNTINTAKTAADYRTSASAAKAAGIVGGANALAGGISNGVNSAASSLTLSKLLKNPAIKPTFNLGTFN